MPTAPTITRLSNLVPLLVGGLLALTCWMLVTPPAIAADKAAADRPNFVLIMSDDQGWGDVGFRDHPVLKTPVLDELASTGLRMDRFYAAAPVCSPTRGSVLTGRHPNRFGDFYWGGRLRPQEITVAEMLREAGYATGHFGKWHLGELQLNSPSSPGNSGFTEFFSSPNFYENNPLMCHNGKVVHTEGEGSLVTVEAAERFIRSSVKQEQPFLAVVWFGTPHNPHVGTPEYLKMYQDEPAKLAHYYAELTAMDRAIGQLRSTLREVGVADNTLLWFTSDNGPQGGPAGTPGSAGELSGRKGSLWEGGIRVPTMIEWPAVVKSPRISQLLSGTVDIYPTVLELAGVKQPAAQPVLDGVSLAQHIRAQQQTSRPPLGFWIHEGKGRPVRSSQILAALETAQANGALPELPEDAGKITRQWPEDEFSGDAAWIDGDWKLRQQGSALDNARLYNLQDDPQEKKNLASAEPERVKQMQAALAAWQKSVRRSLNGKDYPGE